MISTATNTTWYRVWGGDKGDTGYGVASDGTNVYTCGETRVHGVYPWDMIIIGWNKVNGSVVWTQTYGAAGGNRAYGVWVDGNTIWVCGYGDDWHLVILQLACTNGSIIRTLVLPANNTIANAIWGDNASLFTCGSINSKELVIGFNKTTLHQEWNRTWTQTSSMSGSAIWGDDTRVYCCGDIVNSTSENTFIIALDKGTGLVIWNKSISYQNGVNVLGMWGDDQSIYTCGMYGRFQYIAAWDKTSGAQRWQQIHQSGNQGYAEELYAITGHGNVLYTGGIASNYPGGNDVSLIAWNKENGTIIWQSYFGGKDVDNAYAIWCDNESIFACGYSESFCATECYGFGDLLLVKADINGNVPDSGFPSAGQPNDDSIPGIVIGLVGIACLIFVIAYFERKNYLNRKHSLDPEMM